MSASSKIITVVIAAMVITATAGMAYDAGRHCSRPAASERPVKPTVQVIPNPGIHRGHTEGTA